MCARRSTPSALDDVDEFALSFELGAIKPDAAVFSANPSSRTLSPGGDPMSDSERIRPPWWLKYVKKFIGASRLCVGFRDKGPMVLTVPGRKPGKVTA